MNLLYTIGLYAAQFLLKLLAPFNSKLKLGVEGRARTFKILQQHLTKADQTLWFHCASLGEYEQGLPVFKELRKLYANHKIVLTFFSPSGYEIRKITDVADVVVYLPMDSKTNVKRFLNILKPELTIFVKYDFWPNYLSELKKRQHRAILISAAFRPNQAFFKFYGGMMRKPLTAFEHIFVQNEASKKLLNSIHFNNVTVSGDTRFDRVSDQLLQNNNLPFIEAFKNNQLCIVIGSSWPEDEELLVKFINNNTNKNIKYIIAPHNIKGSQIDNLVSKLEVKTLLYSEMESEDPSGYSVFVMDTIGLLSKTYSYADIAYVGGAMGNTGLHNILEPAVFGVPIIIGKNYSKFPEAFDMIENGGLISIKNYDELQSALNKIIDHPLERKKLGTANAHFITQNKGAVIQILNYIRI